MTRAIPSTYVQAATLFLGDLGAPATPDMIRAVCAWIVEENGWGPTIARNNPWNLHSDGGLLGQIGSDYVSAGDANVAVFDTLAHGVMAAVNNLRWWVSKGDGVGYGAVIAAAQSGDATAFLNALAASSWSYGRYGTRNGGPNVLLSIFGNLTPLKEITVATPKPLTPSAEPVVYAGLITSLILAGIQLLVGQGMLTSDQATQLNPQAATIANALVTLLPVIAALITRQAVTPNSKVPSDLPSQPTMPSALPTSGPVIITSGLTVVSSKPVGAVGNIAAGTRRWNTDGALIVDSDGKPSLVGPSLILFASEDVLSGVLTGHFYLTATDHPYYVRWQDITWPSAAAAPSFGWTADGLKERVAPDSPVASVLQPYKPWLSATQPVTDVSGLFIPIDPAKLDQTLDPAGTPGYPHGIAFTWRQAMDWWSYVFAHPCDLTFVEPGLMPGAKVLTPDGLKLADSLSVVGNSNQFAPASFNPLGLPVL